MQRRVKQTDADRLALHDPEQLCKILALHWQQARQNRLAAIAGLSKDHFTHHGQATGIKEHVLCPAQADALRVEIAGGLGIRRRIRIGADADIAFRIRPAHQGLKGIVQRRFEHRWLPRQHLA